MRTVVYCGTRNLYPDMVTAVKSLLCHNGADRVVLMIEDDVFPFPLPACCETINVAGQKWFPETGPNYHKRWTYMAMMRLVFTKLLPNDNRVLYLDVDTIVWGDISELWATSLNGNYIMGALEPDRSKINVPYLNSGVLMMNLAWLRRDGLDDKMIEMINTIPFPFPDQDVLNQVCWPYVKTIDSKWNACDYTEPTDDPRIIHLANVKNWNQNPCVLKYKNM